MGADELDQGRHAGQRRRGTGIPTAHACFGDQDKTRPAVGDTASFGRMGTMPGPYWKQVAASGLAVPQDRPLDDLTAELTRMLGDTDPEVARRHRVPDPGDLGRPRASTTTCSSGLGDGMAAGLGRRPRRARHRLGLPAQLLGADPRRVHRPRQRAAAGPGEQGARVGRPAGDAGCSREQDLRGFVPGKGWAHAVAHGADRSARWRSRRTSPATSSTVLLDVIADRLLLPVDHAASPTARRTGWPPRPCASCAATRLAPT